MGIGIHKKSTRTQGIVVGGSNHKAETKTVPNSGVAQKAPTRRRWLVIASVVVVLLLIGGTILSGQLSKESVYTIPDMGTTSVPPANNESPGIETAVEIDELLQRINKYDVKSLSAREKIELANLYSALGAAYTNDNQPLEAIFAYQSAEKYASEEQQRAIIAGLAYAYVEQGDTEKAIAEFNKLIAVIEKNPDAFSERDIAGYKRTIERLENGEAL